MLLLTACIMFMHCFLESVNTCYCLNFAFIMWLCCNLNRFVLYITVDKFYIPWSLVGPNFTLQFK